MAASSNNSEQIDWGRLMKGDLDYLFNCLDVARYDESKGFLWKCDMPKAEFKPIPEPRGYITTENNYRIFQEACRWRINGRFDTTQWEVWAMDVNMRPDGGKLFWKTLFELAGAKDGKLDKTNFKTFFTTFGFLGNMKKPDGTILIKADGTLEGEAEKAESKPKWPDFYCWTLRAGLLYGFLPEDMKGFSPEKRKLAEETFCGKNSLYVPVAIQYFNKVKDSVPDFDGIIETSKLSLAAFKDCTKLDGKTDAEKTQVLTGVQNQVFNENTGEKKAFTFVPRDNMVDSNEWNILYDLMKTLIETKDPTSFAGVVIKPDVLNIPIPE